MNGKETYTLKCICHNCGHDWEQEFQKGEAKPIKVKCPYCETPSGIPGSRAEPVGRHQC